LANFGIGTLAAPPKVNAFAVAAAPKNVREAKVV